MNHKTFIMLGRTGDVINILPAIEYEANTKGYKPKLVVAKDYADIVDGCSYLEKVVYAGDFREINQAINFVRKNYPDDEIINCTVYGNGYRYQRQCHNFQRESWYFSQCAKAWGHLPLNFDNRDEEREKKFLDSIGYKESNVPLIVASLSGISSPFLYGEQLLKKITSEIVIGKLQKYQFIDISDIKAERMYDLLALYERAHCLIATDSAPLHLAYAIPHLPVISLISDLKDTWHQSGWRPQHLLRLLYSEVPDNLDKIITAITDEKFRNPNIYLVTSTNTTNPETVKRNEKAYVTWFKERMKAGIGNWQYEKYGCGDNVPKVKNMINYISDKAEDNDILMIVNADICFVPGITGQIYHEVERHEAVYFHRHDFKTVDRYLTSEAEVAKGEFYVGSDCFAFTKKWWLQHRDIFPDFYFGREFWDCCIRNLIKRSNGSEIYNAIYHEHHESYWLKNRSCPENLHNKKLMLEWIEKYGGDLLDPLKKREKLKYKY